MESVYRATGESRPSLALVAAVFARDSNLTFGGGTATAETLRREVVARRGWVLDSDFRLAYAASRLTPGTNLLAICAALGSRIRGLEGALIALLASSIPSAAIVAMMMAGYQDVAQYPGVANAARGAGCRFRSFASLERVGANPPTTRIREAIPRGAVSRPLLGRVRHVPVQCLDRAACRCPSRQPVV
jgi:chromate transporter